MRKLGLTVGTLILTLVEDTVLLPPDSFILQQSAHTARIREVWQIVIVDSDH